MTVASALQVSSSNTIRLPGMLPLCLPLACQSKLCLTFIRSISRGDREGTHGGIDPADTLLQEILERSATSRHSVPFLCRLTNIAAAAARGITRVAEISGSPWYMLSRL